MPVTFHKMHGLENDFVLLDLRRQHFTLDENIVRQLADRHTGIGCDQLLTLHAPPNEEHLAAFEVWNADGSRAEQCGNGVRCLGLYLDMCAEAPDGPFLIRGPVASVKVECLGNNQVRVDMGQPAFEPQQVPVLLEALDGWYSLHIDQHSYQLGAVSMGNPHALMIVDDVSATDVAALGAAISSHTAFPEGCNAGFAEVVDRNNIRLRVFERGAAETRACGSGACAAMSILRRAGMVNETINVTQAGGNLILTWVGDNAHVIMTGQATHVFKGNLT